MPVISPVSSVASNTSGSEKRKKAVPFEPSLLRVRRTSGTLVSSVPLTNWIFVPSARTESAERAPRRAATRAGPRPSARADATRERAAREEADVTANMGAARSGGGRGARRMCRGAIPAAIGRHFWISRRAGGRGPIVGRQVRVGETAARDGRPVS